MCRAARRRIRLGAHERSSRQVAGRAQLVMVSPTRIRWCLAAASSPAWTAFVAIGGAPGRRGPAAYGTASLPRVDKIVGPGNVYVAEAKRQVFGQVGIDSAGGPSEILVNCDGRTPPEWWRWTFFPRPSTDDRRRAIPLSPVWRCLNAGGLSGSGR